MTLLPYLLSVVTVLIAVVAIFVLAMVWLSSTADLFWMLMLRTRLALGAIVAITLISVIVLFAILPPATGLLATA